MRLTMVSIVTSALVALAIAKPVPNRKVGGIAIPLTRHSSPLDSNKSIDLDAISSHALSVRERILGALDNYEMNTGTIHPFAVTRSESGLENRGVSVPLARTPYEKLDIWTAEISIGTPPQTFKVRIDTGAADMWVLRTGCSGIVGDRELWNPQSSESSKDLGLSFQLGYKDGSVVEGDQFTDNVTIAGFTADPQTFGSVTSYDSRILDNGEADGFLGLAFSSVSKFGADPLFESLVKQNRLTNPTFSLKLSPSGAELYIGGANSMLYSGDITYTPVTTPGLWQVSMDDLSANGNSMLQDVPVVFDTGSNFIFGDWARVSRMYSNLDATYGGGRGGIGYFHMPCDHFPAVSLTFGGKAFKIPPEALKLQPISEGSSNCWSAIIAVRAPLAFWTIGKTFLQGVYSVFDYGTIKRVGFAELAPVNPTSNL